MKATGKSTIAQDVVGRLKKEKIPSVYIKVGKGDKIMFFSNVLRAFGIYDKIPENLLPKLEWAHVLKLIQDACYNRDSSNGNVILFDNVSKGSPCLAELDNFARLISEDHPSTVVVIVASDATDVFYLRHGM